MTSFCALLAAALAVVPLVVPASAQTVHVVDALDMRALPNIATAVAAADDGDVILVRALGSNGQFTLNGKSLIIAAEAGFSPYVATGFADNNHYLDGSGPHTVIENLQPGQRVVLRGLSFGGLLLRNSDGQVWVEDAAVNFTSPAMRAQDCDSVVLHDVALQGPHSVIDQYFFKVGGAGLELEGSHAVAHDISALGGHGHVFTCSIFGFCSNSSGFHGLMQTGGTLWLAGSAAAGGNGGSGGKDLLGFCSPGGSGGHGVFLAAAAPQLMQRGLLASGGTAATGPAPGICPFGGGGNGVPGQSVAVQSGSSTVLSGTPVTLSVPSPLREQQQLTLGISGPPGAGAVLLAGPQSSVLSISAVSGPLLTGVPLLVLSLGALPASGTLLVQGPVPDLGPGVQAVSWTLQIITIEGGQRIAGPATSLLLLDGAL